MLPRYFSSPLVLDIKPSKRLRVPRALRRFLAATGCLVVISLLSGKLVMDGAKTPWSDTLHTWPASFHLPSGKSEPVNWDMRRDEVQKAFLHAWRGYQTRAFPGDELLAVSGGSIDQRNGWSVTLFDSLDTMWIMGLKKEFKDALKAIKDRHFNTDQFVPVFETTVRYLGGLLSAHALSGEPLLAQLAEELANNLLPAFDGSSVGFPAFAVNVLSGQVKSDRGRNTIPFAEAVSCQLEFKYLAKLTGRKEFYQRIQTAMDVFYTANTTLFHDSWSLKDGTPRGGHFSASAAVHSGYEYLLKQWLQTGDIKARDQYVRSARGIIDNLLFVTPNRGLLYVGDINKNNFNHRLEHLSCHLGGLFALGASTLPLSVLPSEEKELHEWAAKGLTYTCALTYADQSSGLGPEEISMPPRSGRKWVREINRWRKGGKIGPAPGTAEPPVEVELTKRDYWNTWGDDTNLLRPETVESIFYMWRTTGDIKWRERGYKIFLAIEKHTWTKYGYSTVSGIDSSHVSHRDYMPSWFLAETLKYLYLLFEDNSTIPFDKWVFNTKAHPLPIFTWTEEEREKFGF